MKKILAFIMCVTMLLSASACQSEVTETEESDSATTETWVLPTSDRYGNSITVPESIEKIVSMAPSTTQVLIELGLADKIVGIDTYSADMADRLSGDVVQFDMMTPDNEAIAALEPDIVFTTGMSNVGGVDAYQTLRDAGICVADIPSSESLASIEEDIKFIGSCFAGDSAVVSAAQQIISDMDADIEELKSIGSTVSEKKTVLFLLSVPTADYPTVYTFGSGTFLNELIELVGAENVFANQESWISVSVEECAALNPDVIITNADYLEDAAAEVAAVSGWENVAAVQNGEIYVIGSNLSSRPNEHVLDCGWIIGRDIYPDYFTASDEAA